MSRRFVISSAAVCAALVLSAALAGTALANRGFETRIRGFDGIMGAAVDGQDNVWVTDGGQGSKENPGNEGVYKYAPFPSTSLLSVPNTYESFSYYIFWLQPAVDNATGELLISQSNGRTLNFFVPRDPSAPECKEEAGQAETYCWVRQWDRINGANTCFNCTPNMHVGFDNSGTFSEGRVYLALTSPENDIEVFDNEEHTVAFPATAKYITKNKLTGTPSGNFGEVGYVAVDSVGNIFVTDWGKQVVDEFESNGTFLRSFPSPRASAGLAAATGAVGIDPTNGNVLIAEGGYNAETEEGGISEFDAYGNFLGPVHTPKGVEIQAQGEPVVNSNGYAYVPSGSDLLIFAPKPALPRITYKPIASPTPTAGTLEATVDPNGGGAITECKFEYGTATTYGSTASCSPGTFSTTTDVSAPLSGLTTETTYHYRAVVHTASGVRYGEDQVYTPHRVVGLRTKAASNIGEAGATLNGEFLGNAEETHYHFEWGPTGTYGHSTTAAAVTPGNGVSEPLSAAITGLAPFSTYHFRVVANNGAGTSVGEDRLFTTPPGVPTIVTEAVTVVHSDRAILHGTAIANGAPTKVHFEYVSDAEFQQSGFANAISVGEEIPIGMGKEPQTTTVPVTGGLKPSTLYHYREVGINEAGVGVPANPHTFSTFVFNPEINDHCPNAHVRQQTGSVLLLDCRAYELVSAASSGGYDVESSLVAGQKPFAEDYPAAHDASGQPRVLYGVHDGGVPGFPSATNRGVDPYVATRTDNGWKTEYVGIPAGGTPSTRPFSSSLLEADANLETLAFGGPEICSPCFADESTGNPIRLPNGELVQGLTGSEPKTSAEPAGYIGRHLSADGTHFIFGSEAQLETGANNNGDVNVYDRNLTTKTTHLVSKTPGGATMTGPGIGELDVSSDGSRIVVGQLVEEEGDAKRWHLYMNIGDASKTVDLTPGTTHGVLFDGMTGDGSRVFFTTADKLTTASDQDSDSSPDLYEAEVDPPGEKVTLSRVSTGTEGTGDTDECHPSGNTINPQWNTAIAGEEGCGVVAVGGTGGVARGDGSIFFLSPEKLDGSSNGVQDAPNLYVVRPGESPDFVATLESTSNAPLPAPTHPHLLTFGAFKNPAGVAIDDSTGDIYVLDIGTGIGQGFVYKFNPEGKPVFSFGQAGKLIVSGVNGFNNWPTSIAVDNDPASPNHGDFYVPEIDSEKGQYSLKKYSPNGDLQGNIETFFPSGVGVDPATGNVYVAVSPAGALLVYNTNGELAKVLFISEHSPEPEGVAVSNGKVYVVNGGGQSARKGTTEVYTEAGEWLEQLDPNPSRGVAVDTSDGHIFVDEGIRVSEFDGSGNPVGVPAGLGRLSNSISLDVYNGTIAVGNPGQGNAEEYGPLGLPDDPQVNSELVIDSVNHPGARHSGDFEVTPSGAYAAFTTTLPLTEYDNGIVHREVFRYDSGAGTLACASCNPTSEQATGEASLPSSGLGLSDDGRVFFNSTEGLVDRDLNEGADAYEWEPDGYDFPAAQEPCALPIGCVQLISTGNSQFASSLLGISESGTDAYLFTRQKLAEEDTNGNTVKIYDARSLGGYPFVPPEPQCKASDECHGAGTPIPPPPNIKSVAETPGGNLTTPPRCKRGTVRRHGRCVARRHHKKHHRSGHRGGGRHHG